MLQQLRQIREFCTERHFDSVRGLVAAGYRTFVKLAMANVMCGVTNALCGAVYVGYWEATLGDFRTTLRLDLLRTHKKTGAKYRRLLELQVAIRVLVEACDLNGIADETKVLLPYVGETKAGLKYVRMHLAGTAVPIAKYTTLIKSLFARARMHLLTSGCPSTRELSEEMQGEWQ